MAHPCSRCGATADQTGLALCPSCLLRLAALPESRIPDFEIETMLGTGPSRTTYLARGAGGGMLAVKKIAGVEGFAGAAGDLQARLAAFRHEQAAVLHGFQPDEAGVLMVRDFVRGRPFAGWFAQAEAAAQLRALDGLAAVVADLHQHDLAHGHIAAANIVIVRGGEPVLLDAGAQIVTDALHGSPVDLDGVRRADLAALAAIPASA